MKKNEIQKLRELSKEELIKKIEEMKKELLNLSLQKASSKLKDLHAYAKKRKQIAIAKTIKKENELKQ